MSSSTSPKISKLIWLLIMIGVMIIYILIIARLIDAFIPNNIVFELISYFMAGIIWIFPAKWIMFKINRTDNTGKK